jgi:hypothetical protein
MGELRCCICLGEYVWPTILNSGITICYECGYILDQCPLTRIDITAEIANNFIGKFFNALPIFNMENLVNSQDRDPFSSLFNK